MQTITQDDTVDLDVQTTFLSREVTDAPATIAVTLPDGTWVGQQHFLFVPTKFGPETAIFEVGASLPSPFTKLRFDTLGMSALLVWDGTGWQLLGGNATLQ